MLTEAPEKMSKRLLATPATNVAHSAGTHSIFTPVSAANLVIASISKPL